MSKHDGGQAFPTPSTSHQYGCPGMTLRDYFAAAALQGFTANTMLLEWVDRNGEGVPANLRLGIVAQLCYRYADAMLDVRASQ